MTTELQQLQGTWQAIGMESGGNAVAPGLTRRLKYVFEGDRVTLLEDEKATGAGSVAIHPEAVPKAIDVVMTDGPGRGQTALGIYEVAGDRLTLCIGMERPAEFRGAGPAALVTLKRVSPAAALDRAPSHDGEND